MMYPFRSRVKEYVQSTDKLSLIGLTFHAGESYWGIHPYNYHIDDFTPSPAMEHFQELWH